MGAAHLDTAGRAGRPPAGFPRPLRAATPPSRHRAPFMPASIAYHTGWQQRPFRVAGSQLSPRAITTLPTKSAVGTPPVFSDPGDRSTWEVPFFVVVVTPTNRHGTQRASASPVTVTPAVNGIRGGGQQAPHRSLRASPTRSGWPRPSTRRSPRTSGHRQSLRT